jgi:hypothetical protein
MHIAIKFGIPLVFWGEPSSDYTAYYDSRDDAIEEVDETRFNRFVNLGITADDMKGMISGDFPLDPRDLIPYSYPALRDLKKLRYRSVCLGSFIPWDPRTQSQLIMNKLGWEGDQVEGMPPGLYTYEKIECFMQGVRDYIKHLKRGYGRVTQMTALDVRYGRMTLDEANKLVAEHEGRRPQSLDFFLEYLDLTEDQFNDIVSKTVVAPHEPDFKTIQLAPRLHDLHQLYRERAK